MHFLLIAALSLVVFYSAVTLGTNAEVDNPQAARDAAIQVDQYRMFMYVADQYMTQFPPAAAGVVTVTWPTMAASTVAPPGAKTLTMPPSWRVVRAADLSWVACTDMDERSIGSLNQLLSSGVAAQGTGAIASADLRNTAVALVNASSVTTSYVVLGSPTAATTLASLCNS